MQAIQSYHGGCDAYGPSASNDITKSLEKVCIISDFNWSIWNSSIQAAQGHHDVCDNATKSSTSKDLTKSSEMVIVLTSKIWAILNKFIGRLSKIIKM